MIYEVRNYHFRPDLLDQYRSWAEASAVPYLSGKMDVVGFWVNTSAPAEVFGEPQDALGPSNVTWVIRWRDLAQREADWAAALASPEWEKILAQVPGGRASYLRLESKFADSLL